MNTASCARISLNASRAGQPCPPRPRSSVSMQVRIIHETLPIVALLRLHTLVRPERHQYSPRRLSPPPLRASSDALLVDVLRPHLPSIRATPPASSLMLPSLLHGISAAKSSRVLSIVMGVRFHYRLRALAVRLTRGLSRPAGMAKARLSPPSPRTQARPHPHLFLGQPLGVTGVLAGAHHHLLSLADRP